MNLRNVPSCIIFTKKCLNKLKASLDFTSTADNMPHRFLLKMGYWYCCVIDSLSHARALGVGGKGRGGVDTARGASWDTEVMKTEGNAIRFDA